MATTSPFPEPYELSSTSQFNDHEQRHASVLDNVEVKEEDGSMASRKTVTSKIKFSANSNDNQATYACEAVHGGLRGNNMRVSFLLSVQCKSSHGLRPSTLSQK